MSKRMKLIFLFCIIIPSILFMWSCNYVLFRTEIVPALHHKKDVNMKYILQWTKPNTEPFVFMGKGQNTFIKRNCTFQNCFVTADRSYFDDVKEFDVVLFHTPEIVLSNYDRPAERSFQQKYVFVSMESSHYYPMCKPQYNSFFNWTWTYSLNSDASYYYITIRDKYGNIVGPNEAMHWDSEVLNTPIDETIKKILKTKTKAVAWMVSNCKTKSKREDVVKLLQAELRAFGLEIDIFGWCSEKKCPKEKKEDCLRIIERDYYFYLSFENSFSEDYVTEKLLNALQHYAVPIVYGSANYTRFMPDGIYLNAYKKKPAELAREISDAINNTEKYYKFFRWHNLYDYQDPDDAPDSDNYCRFCAMLNDENVMSENKVYDNIIKWWNRSKSCPKPSFSLLKKIGNLI